jgi:hypothetical protein
MLFGIVGCGQSQKGEPAYQLSRPLTIRAGESYAKPLPPGISIVNPKIGSRVHSGEKILCEVKLTVATGSRMPEVVNVFFKKKNTFIAGPTPAIPRNDFSTSGILEAEIEIPKTQGTITVQAEALYTLIILSANKGGKSMSETTRFNSSQIRIEVVK